MLFAVITLVLMNENTEATDNWITVMDTFVAFFILFFPFVIGFLVFWLGVDLSW